MKGISHIKSMMGGGNRVTEPMKVAWGGSRFRGSIVVAVQLLLLLLLVWNTDIPSFKPSFPFNSSSTIQEEWRWNNACIPYPKGITTPLENMSLIRRIDCANKKPHMASLL